MTCTICIPNGARCGNHIPTHKEATMKLEKTLLEILNDAADCLLIEGWTNHDFADRNDGDGEDIITAIAKYTRKWDKEGMQYAVNHKVQDDAIRYCVEALTVRLTDEGADCHLATYLPLIESEYPGASLVHWQTHDCSDKWDAIGLIEEACDILLSLV